MYRPHCEHSVHNLGGIYCLSLVGWLFTIVFTYLGFAMMITGQHPPPHPPPSISNLISPEGLPQIGTGNALQELLISARRIKPCCLLAPAICRNRQYQCQARQEKILSYAGVMWAASLPQKIRQAWRQLRRASRSHRH